MFSQSQRKSIELLTVFAWLVVSSPLMTKAEEAVGNSATVDNKTDKSRESKRIDLGDGLALEEYREFNDGNVAVLIKTYERNGEKIMRLISMPGEDDMRTFFRDGKEILSEAIDDKGRIVRIVVSRDDGSWFELFEQQDDGAIAPISTAKLRQALKQFEFMTQNFTPFADAVKKGNKKEADKRLDSMIEKIKAGESDAAEQDSE